MNVSVKVMLSYDYCHFEIVKGTDQELTNDQINEMRKDVQRLADEAVRQYIVAKQRAGQRESFEKKSFDQRIQKILAKPESELSIEETAMLKQHHDVAWQAQFEPYDYEDEDERDWQ